MNKKKNPEEVRKYQYTVWLNKPEKEKFLGLVEQSSKRESDFIRQMITRGFVNAQPKKEDSKNVLELLKILIEYRTNFRRISNLIKNTDPSLTSEVEKTVRDLQHIIDSL